MYMSEIFTLVWLVVAAAILLVSVVGLAGLLVSL